MTRGPTTAAAHIVVACVLIGISAAAAGAKGPDQAVVTGPGMAHPIAVRAPGARTIGPDMAALVESSGIIPQLWCRGCDELTARQPTAELGPMFLVRYRLPSLTSGRTNWVEQHVYPFAHPQPVTYVAPGQPFWGRRTAGGWFESEARLRRILVGIGVPDPTASAPTIVDTASVTPTWLSLGLIAVALVPAVVAGLFFLARGWARGRAGARANTA